MYLRALIPLHLAGQDLAPGQPFVVRDAEAAAYLDPGWAQPIHGAPPAELVAAHEALIQPDTAAAPVQPAPNAKAKRTAASPNDFASTESHIP